MGGRHGNDDAGLPDRNYAKSMSYVDPSDGLRRGSLGKRLGRMSVLEQRLERLEREGRVGLIFEARDLLAWRGRWERN